MKYKVGDIIRIKDHENPIIQKEIRKLLNKEGLISEILIDKFHCNRMYGIENFEFFLLEEEIECIIETNRITSRFDILDL